MSKSLAEGISPRALVERVADGVQGLRMNSKHTRVWDSFRWGAVVAAIATGVFVGGYAHDLIYEAFAVATQGWGLLALVVWITCTAVAVNVVWLSVKVLGFCVEEVVYGASDDSDKPGSPPDPEAPSNR